MLRGTEQCYFRQNPSHMLITSPLPKAGVLPAPVTKRTGHQAPSVCLIHPFDPKMLSGSVVAASLDRMCHKLDERWKQRHSRQVYEPVLEKFRGVLGDLNYNTHKKSICIFLSEEEVKILYLDILVRPALLVDRPFNIRDVIDNKSEKDRYLALLISEEKASLYVNDFEMNSKLVYELPAAPYGGDFITEINRGLGELRRYHPHPLFVFGDQSGIRQLESLTGDPEIVFRYQETDPGFTIDEIPVFVEPYSKDWQAVNRWQMLSRMLEGYHKGKVAVGVPAISKVLNRHDHSLLVMEKNYTCTAVAGCRDKNGSPLKDMAGELIEKVLVNGGDVCLTEEALPPFILFG